MRRFLISHGLNRERFFSALLVVFIVASCIQPGVSTIWTWKKLTGSTQDRPGLELHLDTHAIPVHYWIDLAVRGADNKIYFGMVNPVDGSESGWQLVGGASPSGPAISYYNDSKAPPGAIIAVRGMDDAIYWKLIQNTTWHKLSGSTLSSPAINATDYHILYVLVRGKDNGIYLCKVNMLKNIQGTWQKLSGTTKDSPSFFMSGGTSLVGGMMYIAVRGMDDAIYWSSFNLGTYTQSAWHKIAGKTLSAPSITYWDSNHFTIGVRGLDNRIYYQNVGISDNNQPGWNVINGLTPSGPAMQSPAGTLFLWVCARGNDNGIYYTSA